MSLTRIAKASEMPKPEGNLHALYKELMFDLHDKKGAATSAFGLAEIGIVDLEENGQKITPEVIAVMDELRLVCYKVYHDLGGVLDINRESPEERLQSAISQLVATREGVRESIHRIIEIISSLSFLSEEDKILVNSSLSFSEQEINPEEVSSEELFGIIDTISKSHGEGLNISYYSDVAMIRMDRVHLIRLLSNIIGNARKYTPRDTQVFIDIKKVKDFVQLEISDDGPGFHGDPESIFKLHQQDKKEHQDMGHGLGLAYCRDVVELHGGTISAYNKADSPEWLNSPGAVFVINLPLFPDRISYSKEK